MTQSAITVTPSARTRIEELVRDDGENGQVLRLRVEPGGCSGFEYRMELDYPADDDEVVDSCVAVDRVSIPYLIGARLDHSVGFQSAGFVLDNPNATGACGCGRSFAA